MNIKQAKKQIKQAVNAYRQKDEFGEYVIPVVRQRPIFLMGAPGIGKTAIMEQIAQELGIGLVTYSMTHHTRQSALGLPFIVHKTYRGEDYQVSEYTMSEIIASVYEQIEQFNLQEGILFLDEINCVSETLAPSMLQFLQYKIFGRHRVPDGWIVVTAGIPCLELPHRNPGRPHDECPRLVDAPHAGAGRGPVAIPRVGVGMVVRHRVRDVHRAVALRLPGAVREPADPSRPVHTE